MDRKEYCPGVIEKKTTLVRFGSTEVSTVDTAIHRYSGTNLLSRLPWGKVDAAGFGLAISWQWDPF